MTNRDIFDDHAAALSQLAFAEASGNAIGAARARAELGRLIAEAAAVGMELPPIERAELPVKRAKRAPEDAAKPPERLPEHDEPDPLTSWLETARAQDRERRRNA